MAQDRNGKKLKVGDRVICKKREHNCNEGEVYTVRISDDDGTIKVVEDLEGYWLTANNFEKDAAAKPAVVREPVHLPNGILCSTCAKQDCICPERNPDGSWNHGYVPAAPRAPQHGDWVLYEGKKYRVALSEEEVAKIGRWGGGIFVENKSGWSAVGKEYKPLRKHYTIGELEVLRFNGFSASSCTLTTPPDGVTEPVAMEHSAATQPHVFAVGDIVRLRPESQYCGQFKGEGKITHESDGCLHWHVNAGSYGNTYDDKDLEFIRHEDEPVAMERIAPKPEPISIRWEALLDTRISTLAVDTSDTPVSTASPIPANWKASDYLA